MRLLDQKSHRIVNRSLQSRNNFSFCNCISFYFLLKKAFVEDACTSFHFLHSFQYSTCLESAVCSCDCMSSCVFVF